MPIPAPKFAFWGFWPQNIIFHPHDPTPRSDFLGGKHALWALTHQNQSNSMTRTRSELLLQLLLRLLLLISADWSTTLKLLQFGQVLMEQSSKTAAWVSCTSDALQVARWTVPKHWRKHAYLNDSRILLLSFCIFGRHRSICIRQLITV